MSVLTTPNVWRDHQLPARLASSPGLVVQPASFQTFHKQAGAKGGAGGGVGVGEARICSGGRHVQARVGEAQPLQWDEHLGWELAERGEGT